MLDEAIGLPALDHVSPICSSSCIRDSPFCARRIRKKEACVPELSKCSYEIGLVTPQLNRLYRLKLFKAEGKDSTPYCS